MLGLKKNPRSNMSNHFRFELLLSIRFSLSFGGARGVMVIVAGIGHGDTSSNPGRD